MNKPDFFALLIGPPGVGKSALAYELAARELENGSWLFAQDVNREFSSICVQYDSAAAWKRAADASTGKDGEPTLSKSAGIACKQGADELAALVLELGRRWNQDKGIVTSPIACVLNETSALKETGSTHIGNIQEELLNQRRHLGVRPIYCMQRASQLPQSVWDVVTDVYLFRQKSRKRVKQLEEKMDLDPGQLAHLRALPKHEWDHWTPDDGLDSEK